MADKLIEKYSKRVAKEGILKAFLIALSVACGVLALTEFFSWFFGFKEGLYLGIGLFVLVLGACTPLLYFYKFRPTLKVVAKRIDELGLEERVLTMTEQSGDDSFIAVKQREDTVRALGQVNHMLIKIAASAALIAIAAVFVFVGLGMTTVGSLYVAGVIPSGLNSLSGLGGAKDYVVSYEAELSDTAIAALKASSTAIPESGFGTVYYYDEDNWATMQAFEGQIEVKEGNKAPAVLAVAAANYVFVEWSDGSRDPSRMDVVDNNISLVAFFEPIDDMNVNDPELQDPESLGSGPSDFGDEGEKDPDSDHSENGKDENQSSAGGTHNTAGNTILDGDTYYGDDFSNAYDEAQDRLGSDKNLTDEKKNWADDYFKSIEGGN